MPKGKIAKEALEALSKTKFARGAGVVGGAKVVEETVDNPYAQAAIGAAEGAALGAALGPWGAAGGAVAGGLLGFVLADGERIAPVDLIAVPAYQYSAMLQGREPTFQIFIKEGEIIKPLLPTDAQLAGRQAIVEEELYGGEMRKRMAGDKPYKLNAWQRYVKNKRNHIKYKSGPRKGRLNLVKMGKEFRKKYPKPPKVKRGKK